jgi:hypothetical protein
VPGDSLPIFEYLRADSEIRHEPEKQLYLTSNAASTAKGPQIDMEFSDIRDHKEYLFFFAEVRYDDAFRTSRATRVAYFYDFPERPGAETHLAKFRRKGSASFNRAE